MSKGGFAALASMERADMKRASARRIRAEANKYSTEYQWVLDAHRAAKKLEEEADAEDYSRREQ